MRVVPLYLITSRIINQSVWTALTPLARNNVWNEVFNDWRQLNSRHLFAWSLPYNSEKIQTTSTDFSTRNTVITHYYRVNNNTWYFCIKIQYLIESKSALDLLFWIYILRSLKKLLYRYSYYWDLVWSVLRNY